MNNVNKMNALHIELDEKTNVNDLLQIDTIISMLTIEIVFSPFVTS